jgi:hypothetical protein
MTCQVWRTAQVAPALRNLAAVNGLKLDLNETEWHNLQRAQDFATQYAAHPTFMDWRREGRWLIQWMGGLSQLIATPEVLPADEDEVRPERAGEAAEALVEGVAQGTTINTRANAAFPVLRALVLRQDADANVPRRNADDEGENDRRLVGAKTRPLNQALSVRSSLG